MIDAVGQASSSPGAAVVSVLIPVRNEADFLRRTVPAMLSQDLPAGVEFLFVDGQSEDPTVAILRNLQAADRRIRILDNPARTTAVGLNIGLAEARGEYIARMDAHTFYPPEYLACALDRLARGDAAWVAGPQVPQGDSRWSRAVARALSSPLGRGGSNKWGVDEDESTDGEFELQTSVFTGVWRRETLQALGGWDEDWPVNQDSELAARVIQDGGRIVCLPALAARYVPRDTLEGLARQYFRYGYYRAKTAHRHPRSLRPQLLTLPLLAGFVATSCIPGGLGTPGRLIAVTYAAAAAGLAGWLRLTQEEQWREIPVALAVMHLSWGFGFVRYAGEQTGIGRQTE